MLIGLLLSSGMKAPFPSLVARQVSSSDPTAGEAKMIHPVRSAHQ